MKTMDYVMKYCRWLPFLAGCLAFGCAGGPHQQQPIWPWEYGKDYGTHQTGDYIGVSGSVGHFGEVPKASKPITPESLESPVPDSKSQSESPKLQSKPPLLPAVEESGSGNVIRNVTRDYDFTVSSIKITPPSYLPTDSVRTTYDITASNHGNAPVSVTIGIDPGASQNLATDKPLPLNAVVHPHTDQTVVQFAPKKKNEAYNFRYSYLWSIGDYTARHLCPEHYLFPFGDNVRAFASVSNNTNTSPYSRYAVIFSMPAGTPVLAARKGVVVQIKSDDKIDILHGDSTIATYSHLGKIAEGIIVGKTVSTTDIIGTAGSTDDQKEAYMQLTVWRPEPVPPITVLKTNSQSSGFELVSFPLEFCSTDFSGCRVLTKNQWVSRNKTNKKQTTHKLKQSTKSK